MDINPYCIAVDTIYPRPGGHAWPRSSVMSNPYHTRSVLQPNMVNANVAGTSGFRSPSIPTHVSPQLNSTWAQSALSRSQIPFPTSSASLSYQFPPPLGGSMAAVYMDSSGINMQSQAPAPTEVDEPPPPHDTCSAGQNGFSSPWTCSKAWDILTNGTGTISSPVRSTGCRKPAPSKNKHLCKRKACDRASDAGPGQKVFIDEDRMALHLQELNLDNNNLNWHPDLEERPWYTPHQNNNNTDHCDVEEEEMNDVAASQESQLPKLHLSSEVKLAMKSKQFLPKPILEELTKPSMQLVIWKPPGDFVKDILPSTMTDTSDLSVDDVNVDVTEMSEDCQHVSNADKMLMLPSIPQPLPIYNNHNTETSIIMDDDDMDL